jgi:peptidyl-tRNA hydrolase, PTH1 family
MKLIVGLGNPGDKYERTRHNAGFWLIERFAVKAGIALRKETKFQALVGRHEPSGVWLLLPQSFMNASGRPVHMLASFFKIPPAEILVVHDELDFAPGVGKIKQGGGIAGHNGLRDISARLGSHDYWRLRIGIGHPGERQAVSDYVLNKPSAEERTAIDGVIERALDVLPLAIAGDMQGAMLKLHTQDKIEMPAPPKPAEPQHKKEKPSPAAISEKPEKAKELAVKTETREKPVTQPAQKSDAKPAPAKPEKKGGLGSLFKKILPGKDS